MARKELRRARRSRFDRFLVLERLEERTLLTSFPSPSFIGPTDIFLPRDSQLSGVVTGDFSHNGKLDLAVSTTPVSLPGIFDSQNYGLEIFPGNGDGTFQNYVDYPFPQLHDVSQILAADLTGNGNLDLITKNNDEQSEVYVEMSNPDGTFQAPLDTGLSGSDVVVGDFSGDGKPDLVVSGMEGVPTISIAIGNGNGTFQAPQVMRLNFSPTVMIAGDFMGNGKLDIVAATDVGSDQLYFLAGNGDGTFQQPVLIANGVVVNSVAAADLNGNGKLDLVTTNNLNAVQVWMGNGDGSFQNPVSYPVGSEPGAVTLANLNGDGKPDIVVADTQSGGISVLLNNGDGTFGPMTEYNVAGNPSGVAVGDFNGDGKPDIVAVEASDHDAVSLLTGNGDGTFRDSYQISTGADTGPWGVATGDLNGDGLDDIVTSDGQQLFGSVPPAGYGVSVLLNNGHGGFDAPVYYPTGPGSNPQGMALADLTGNGKLDLVVADAGTNSLIVFMGNGDGTFQAPVDYPSGGTGTDELAIGDVNGDGTPDLVAVNQTSETVSVLLGNGDGTFAPAATYPIDTQTGTQVIGTAIVLADFNGDGKLDIAVSGGEYHQGIAGETPEVSILLNNGAGTFGPPSQILGTGSGPYGDIAAADLNGDGKTDLIAAGGLGMGVELLGNGDGTFTIHPIYGGPYAGAGSAYAPGASGVAVADFNGDGIPDLVFGTGSQVAFMQGNGDGTFQPAVWVDDGPGSGEVAIGDFDGDGLPDVVAADPNSGAVSVLTRGGGTVAGPDSLAISGPVVALTGTPYSVTVRAVDSSGAVDTDFTGTVALTSTDPAAVLPPPHTFTAADQGVYTFTLTPNTVGNQTVTATDTAGTPAAASAPYPVSVFAAVAQPTFTDLSVPTVASGTVTFTITGHLAANAGGASVPAGESILIVVDGNPLSALLDDNDNFSLTCYAFSSGNLAVPVDFYYAGDPNFAPATGTASGTVVAYGASFSNLSAPVIVVGTASTTVSGHLDSSSSSQNVPAGESIFVTLAGVTQTATLDANDDFSTTFATGSLTIAGSPYPINFSYSGDANFAAATGQSTLTVTPDTPSFDDLSAPVIPLGTASTTVSGHLNGGNANVPAGESISVTLAGVTQLATLDANDYFATTFATGSLSTADSPYPIVFSYAGDSSFAPATGQSTLSVGPAATSFSDLSAPTISFATVTTTVSGHLDTNGGPPPLAGEAIVVTLAGVSQTAVLDASDNFSATFATADLTVTGSPYPITFSYAGDVELAPATGRSTLTVQPAATTVALTSATVLYDNLGQYFELDALVSGPVPVNEGSVSFGVPGSPTATDPSVVNGVASVVVRPAVPLPAGIYSVQVSYQPGPDYLAASATGQLVVDAPPTLPPVNGDNSLNLPVSQFPATVPLSATSAVGLPLTYSATVSGDNPLYDLEQQYHFTGVGTLTAGATAYVLKATSNNAAGNPYYLLNSSGGLYAYDGSGSYAHTFADSQDLVRSLDPSVYADPTQLLDARAPVNYATLNGLMQQYQFTGLGYLTAGATAYVLHTNQQGPAVGGYYLLRSDGSLFAYDGSRSYTATFAAGNPVAALGAGVYSHPDELLDAVAPAALYPQLNSLEQQYDLQTQGSVFSAAATAGQAQWIYSPVLNQYGQHWYTLTLNSAGDQATLVAWQGFADPAAGTALATLAPSVFSNPQWLTNAAAPPDPAVNATVDGSGNLTIALPNATYTGSFKVTVSVSDGQMSSSESVLVTSTDTPPTISVDQNSNPVPQGGTLTVPHGGLPLSVTVNAGGSGDTVTASVSGYSLPFALQQRYQFRGLGYLTAGATAYVLQADNPNAFGNPYYLLSSSGGLYAYDGSGSFAHTFANSTPLATLGANAYADPTLLTNAQPAVDYTSLYNLQQQYQFTGLGYLTAGASAYVLHSNQPGPGVGGFYLLRNDGTLFPYDGSGSYADSFVNESPIATLGAAVYADPGALPGADAAPAVYAQLLQLEQQYDLQEMGGSFYTGLYGNAAKWLYSPVPNANGQHWYTLVPSADGSSASLYAWDGGTSSVPAGSQPLAVVDGSVYANPTLLTNARAPLAPVAVTATLSGGTLTVNSPSSFVGTFEVTVTATDGVTSSAQSFLVSSTDTPPALSTIPPQTVSASGGPVQLTLSSTDAENDPVTYSAQAAGYSAAYNLQQLYHFTGLGYFKVGGVTAYVLHSNVPGGVGGYYLLNSEGGVFAYDGSGSYAHSFAGTPLATLDASVYNTPTALTQAQPPAAPVASVSVSGNTLTINAAGMAAGSVFEVFVTASDGAETTRTGFLVTVTA